MKISKKIASITIIFTSFIFALLLSCQNVKAQFYNASANRVIESSIFVSREKNKLEIAFQYQNGIKDISVYICENSNQTRCASNPLTLFFDDSVEINRGDDSAKYEATYSVPTKGKALSQYADKITSSGKSDNKYYLFVKATFCVLRDENKTKCEYWDVYESGAQQNQGKYTSASLEFEMESGYTGSAQLNTTIGKILYIVNTIVIPVLWVALGVLLVVRGIILGIDIVKSADEPDVRKSKINGLIWLFVGVAIGFAATIAASIIMTSFGYGGIFS